MLEMLTCKLSCIPGGCIKMYNCCQKGLFECVEGYLLRLAYEDIVVNWGLKIDYDLQKVSIEQNSAWKRCAFCMVINVLELFIKFL